MKRCYRNIKSNRISLFIIMVLMLGLVPMQQAFSASVAMVTAVKGRAFVFQNGKTTTLKTGDTIEDFSEVLVEEGGQLSLADYFDHRFHVAGAGHLRLMRRLVDLKRGHLWVQTMSGDSAGQVQTANARADHDGAEFMISFDAASGKTQLLSMQGIVQFANLLEEDFVMDVKEGHFSFIDKEFENGRPRIATPIGQQSFKKVLSLYGGITPVKGEEYLFPKESSSANRAVASVTPAPTAMPRAPAASGEEGSFIYRKMPDKVEVKEFDVDSFHKSKLEMVRKKGPPKKWAPSYDRPSKLKINIFSAGSTSGGDKKAAKRTPASIPTSSRGAMAVEINPQVIIPDSTFEADLTNEYKRQMRHSNDVNRLIEDLRNYDSDYQIRH